MTSSKEAKSENKLEILKGMENIKKQLSFFLIIFVVLTTFCFCKKTDSLVKVYLTSSDKTKTMYQDTTKFTDKPSDPNQKKNITIDLSQSFQQMDGFGVAITGSSCYNLLQMTAQDRAELLKETFDPIDGFGFSYIRISIGASDFSLDEYTYCDKPGIDNFDIHEYDKKHLFPILKEILAINPQLKIMASPWTPPKWMKVNNLDELKPFDSWTSGQLNPKYYKDYAIYFAMYIKRMNLEGFDIESITIQNEPLNRGNSASLFMTWQEQCNFVKVLGPEFEKEGIRTKIIIYDHNYDYDSFKDDTKGQEQYPLKIYEDQEAAKYIDGAAYHAYGGDKNELLKIHEASPSKNLYFTEISIGLWGEGYSFAKDLIWNMREVCIGTINNYCKAVIVWNYLLDDKHGPSRPNGCDICLGAIDINSNDYKTLTKNSHYYTMAHLAKVIKPGAYRVLTNNGSFDKLHYSAFKNQDGTCSMVLLNEGDEAQDISVSVDNRIFEYSVPGGSVSSYIWTDNQ